MKFYKMKPANNYCNLILEFCEYGDLDFIIKSNILGKNGFPQDFA